MSQTTHRATFVRTVNGFTITVRRSFTVGQSPVFQVDVESGEIVNGIPRTESDPRELVLLGSLVREFDYDRNELVERSPIRVQTTGSLSRAFVRRLLVSVLQRIIVATQRQLGRPIGPVELFAAGTRAGAFGFEIDRALDAAAERFRAEIVP
jgi:hypothetical protein